MFEAGRTRDGRAYLRGVAAGRGGHRERALEDLRRYLRDAPRGSYAAKAKKHLREWGGE